MRLFVVGASGNTGQELVQQALEDGHAVTAYVRNLDKITTKHDNLKVRKGDIFKTEDIAALLPGHDAVISCLGFPKNPQPVTGYLESHKAIVEAMRKACVGRLITISSWFSHTDSAKDQSFIIRWVVVPYLKPVLDGMQEMEIFLQGSCQDINYTVVRPPQLGKGPQTGKEIHTKEDYFVDTGCSSNKTNRSDVAAFMLSCLTTSLYDGKMVAITTTPIKK